MWVKEEDRIPKGILLSEKRNLIINYQTLLNLKLHNHGGEGEERGWAQYQSSYSKQIIWLCENLMTTTFAIHFSMSCTENIRENWHEISPMR